MHAASAVHVFLLCITIKLHELQTTSFDPNSSTVLTNALKNVGSEMDACGRCR